MKQRMKAALEEIRKMAMEHPAFERAFFDARDFDAMAEVGGEVCDWTIIAILADDALRAETAPNGRKI